MKYVMFRANIAPDTYNFFPIVFPDSCVHALIADAINTMPGYRCAPVAVSAGNVTFCMKPGTICFGKSESTGLCSHPDDGRIFDFGETMGHIFDPRIGCKTYPPIIIIKRIKR